MNELKKDSPLVMGIINCTPDSFFSGSRKEVPAAATETAARMITDGAEMLDIGGESTRPGSSYISLEEELERTIPVIKAIRALPSSKGIQISIDTRKRRVAEAALDAGADIINDISALRDDPDMTALAAERGCPVVIMHMLGTPENMQKNPSYENVVEEVKLFLLNIVEKAAAAGVESSKIILDPGIGFGKRQEDNLALIRHIDAFAVDGHSVLIGLSRKSFIGKILNDAPPEERLIGSLAANGWCVTRGARILRVHDVKETVQMVRVLKEIQWIG
ncbi:MAG: dihydropteroate synthase [Spirochaetaceae bacterium 4572_59]|nr:MAG: dihydropteroate synthase [Spirochaetaceae bacterium 4572_59]